jgi:Fur family zinc uptake transcriptional regulator
MSVTSDSNHNHAHCINDALVRAKAHCKNIGARLTPIRLCVLELIWQSHKPMGAYDLLPLLEKQGFNSAPPTVYRALEFLQEQGLIHRIASLNAFLGCSHSDESHQGLFLICQDCGNAQEISNQGFDDAFTQVLKDRAFTLQHSQLEVSGICSDCSAKGISS